MAGTGEEGSAITIKQRRRTNVRELSKGSEPGTRHLRGLFKKIQPVAPAAMRGSPTKRTVIPSA